MTTCLRNSRRPKNDFEKVLADLEKEVYFRTGDMRQKYILDLKNVWGKTSDCPVKDIRSKPQEELWGKEILPSLTLVSENLIYHPRVLALTRELRAHARREFLALLEDVDVICQEKSARWMKNPICVLM